jgi:hypothetical protein
MSHCFVADLDTSLVKQIFHIAQRQRKPNVKHHRQTDDLWARLEVAKGERWVIQKGYADAIHASSQFLLTEPV